ncbi:MAG TPA: biosynthetic peptidoglycan transglycosylase [Candidatus Nitrosotalea sp.]|nr:biosynthetic peptidoglycan transglycosylase [Candidatus Nitrosotalea sp.]
MTRRRVLAVVGVALALALVLAWNLSPSMQDVQTRVAQRAHLEHVPLLESGAVPPLLAEAVISIEDERFYQDHGIDIVGIVRAALFDATKRCLCEGGSTIDEQLVKDIYLGGDDHGPSKLMDLLLAVKLQTKLSKPVILADYVSTITTGPNLYGVAAAACAYYGKTLDQLTLPEDALIAGLTQDPALYDPLVHPHAAAARRQEVLVAMLSEGYITSQAASAAANAAIAGTPGTSCAA